MSEPQKSKGEEKQAADSDKEKDSGSNNKKASVFEYYEVTVSLIKAVVWPIVALYFFLVLRGPIIATVEQLPNLASKTSNITIAGVTLEIDQRLRAEAPLDLRNALAGLSPDALKLLVRTGKATHYSRTSIEPFLEEEAALKELADTGLIDLQIGELNDPRHPDDDVRWKATALGDQAYSFVLEVVIDQLLRTAPTSGN